MEKGSTDPQIRGIVNYFCLKRRWFRSFVTWVACYVGFGYSMDSDILYMVMDGEAVRVKLGTDLKMIAIYRVSERCGNKSQRLSYHIMFIILCFRPSFNPNLKNHPTF